MTTAHRPTFDTAKGGTGKNEGDLSKLSQQYSSKDMPSHTKMKYRQRGQSSVDELKEKMSVDTSRRLLDEKEREAATATGREPRRSSANRASTDASAAAGSSVTSSKRARFADGGESNALDADDPLDELDDADSGGDDGEEDDTAELMAELARIKKERAAEKTQREDEHAEKQDRIRTENILQGNPLLNPTLSSASTADFKVKRRWDDDVVFKNCAKGIDERKKEPTFINDAIRSEFHKKFMEKYIK